MANGTQSKPLTKLKNVTVYTQPAFFYGAMNLTHALILRHNILYKSYTSNRLYTISSDVRLYFTTGKLQTSTLI